MNDAWVVKRLKANASEALAGRYDSLLACRDISDFTHDLPALSSRVIARIEAVAAEAGDLTPGTEKWTEVSGPLADRADAALRDFLADLELSPEERRAMEIARNMRVHVRELALRTLAGDYDPLLACRDIDEMRPALQGISESVALTFIGVSSEVDEYPIGPERKHWAAEALREKDVLIADYRAQVRDVVNEALRGLLSEYGATGEALD